jgi:peptidoglycan pentaglycine glycine transferase (the first glycine)
MISASSPASSPSASLTVRELNSPDDHTSWNTFAGRVPEGDVLQAWEWGGVKSPDWSPVRLGVFQGETLIGGAAILKRKLPLVGNFYYAPRGPLLEDWTNDDALTTLLNAIRQRAALDGAAFLKIDPAVPIERTDVTDRLAKHGFAPPPSFDAQGFGGTQPRCVMQLDLAGRTEADLLAAFKPQARRNIKLSTEKHGVEVVSNLTRADLSVFNDLMQVTGARDGFRPRLLSYFQTLWDNLVPAGLAKLFLTRYEGQILSGALCFVIGDKAWYVYGASSNEQRNVMPNYAMQWAMIRWAREIGCTWYDFRGVSPRRRNEGEAAAELEKEDHLQGLNRFKEGFGTRYVEYIGEFDLVYNKSAYWLYTQGKPAAQKLVRRLKPR